MNSHDRERNKGALFSRAALPAGSGTIVVVALGALITVSATLGLIYFGATAIEVLRFFAITTLCGLGVLLALFSLTRPEARDSSEGWIRSPVNEDLEERLFSQAEDQARSTPSRAALVLSPQSHVARRLQSGVIDLNRHAMALSDPGLAIDWMVENPEFFDLVLLDVDGLGMPATINFLQDMELTDPEMPIIAVTMHLGTVDMYALREFVQTTTLDAQNLSKRTLRMAIVKALSRDLSGRHSGAATYTGKNTSDHKPSATWQPKVVVGAGRSQDAAKASTNSTSEETKSTFAE